MKTLSETIAQIVKKYFPNAVYNNKVWTAKTKINKNDAWEMPEALCQFTDEVYNNDSLTSNVISSINFDDNGNIGICLR